MRSTILYQRIESLAILFAAVYFYFHLHFSSIFFIIFLVVIDVSMAGYIINNKVGARIYNTGHSYAIPAVLLVLGAALPSQPLLALGLVWATHIALDRTLGYGLKLESGFQNTHLGIIGKKVKRN